MQSPTSINTYLQCPRKYFFQYKLKLPTFPSIHLVRGSVAHLALENFYSLVPEVIGEEYKRHLKTVLVQLLHKYWKEAKPEFDELDMSQQQIDQYYNETVMMMEYHADIVIRRLDDLISQGYSFPDAFRKISPDVEVEYLSWDHYVKGFIDVVEEVDGKVRLMDYKTSKRNKLSEQYKLQLAIYAFLYKEKHGELPDEVGIYFLKFPGDEGVLTVPADDDLVKLAAFQVEQIHMSTTSDNVGDYPLHQSPLCNWCDYYDYCFKDKPIPEKPVR